ncbi:MAG: maleylpyruvate isomerase N-terminal domain-containing protein [Acidimicrobiales bacterium]
MARHSDAPKDPAPWLDALAGSHRDLSSAVRSLDDEDLRLPSYCDEWSVAQVLSHLGSGAEIFRMRLDAILAGEPPPAREQFPDVWDRWNAKSPEDQAADFVTADARVVASLQDAADRLAGLEITLFGSMTVDGAGFVGMRLNEHALHAWDVAVTFDPSARVRPDAVGMLIERLPAATYAGHAEGAGDERPWSSVVVTTDSARAFSIEVGDDIAITEVTGTGAVGDLHLPAESTLRLVYGRLDPAHRPPVDASELPALDQLGRIFSGF